MAQNFTFVRGQLRVLPDADGRGDDAVAGQDPSSEVLVGRSNSGAKNQSRVI